MPKPRSAKLETPTARLRLKVRKRPYWVKVGPGTWVGYRRNQSAGTWSARVGNEDGTGWEKRIALADDLEPARPPRILTYWEALAEAQKLGRTDPGAAKNPSKPLTLDQALTEYAADLKARDADPYNAKHPRRHLTAALLSKPVKLLSDDELEKWRNRLVEKGELRRASINRMISSVRACLELIAPERRHVWRKGLEKLPNSTRARRLIFPDRTIRQLVRAAYEHDHQVGLFCDVLAETGARSSQVQRLLVGDLIGGEKPKLLMSKSGKGGGRNRAQRKLERYPVPITSQLAQRLKQAAAGRADDTSLLLRGDGRQWSETNSLANYRRDFRLIVARVGLDPDKVTSYCFRHSSIVRALLGGVRTKLVASLHDTSVAQIEAHYAKYIADHEHADEIARAALLQPDPPRGDNVVVLPPRQP